MSRRSFEHGERTQPAVRRSSLIGSIAAMLFMLLLPVAAFGQTGTSGITGVVTDPQGRSVAGATVTLTNLGTNASRTTQTTESGTYVFDLISPGDYRVEVEAAGFRKAVVDNAKALIGKQTEVSIRLDIGQVNQIVEVSVSNQSAQINTQDASLGNVMESSQISQLPLEGR